MASGIPALLTPPKGLNSALLLVADVGAIFRFFQQPNWGIFQKGKPIIVSDAVTLVSIRKNWRVADYPMEGGAFQSYNKVTVPFDARVTLVRGGDENERSDFLEKLENLAKSVEIVDVTMPEADYTSCTVSMYEFRRTAREGAQLIIAEIGLTEVRQTVNVTVTTGSPSGAGARQGGQVQATAPPTSILPSGAK